MSNANLVPLTAAPDLTKPYLERATIENGALAGRKLEICWLKDPTDLFFAQIQGSARIKLVEDARCLQLQQPQRLALLAIGGILINREIVTRRNVDGPHPRMDRGQSEGRQGTSPP